MSNHRDAADLARGAGALQLRVRTEPPGRDLAAHGDRESNQYLRGELPRRHPADAILSEESADDMRRITARRVWILDPLDGSREFAEQGPDDWAVPHCPLGRRQSQRL